MSEKPTSSGFHGPADCRLSTPLPTFDEPETTAWPANVARYNGAMIPEAPDRRGWMDGRLASLPACPPFPAFTDFEMSALKAISALFGDEAERFLVQLRASKVVDRINTAHGFYTRVSVDRSLCQPMSLDQKGGSFEVEGIQHGIGVLLWGDDGFLETIEGYSYGGDPLLGRSLPDLKFLGTERLG